MKRDEEIEIGALVIPNIMKGEENQELEETRSNLCSQMFPVVGWNP